MAMRVVVDNGPRDFGRDWPARKRKTGNGRAPVISLRRGVAADAPALLALIASHLDEGKLLPRTLDELTVHAPRFMVAVDGDRIVGCAELAPLSASVAEVRSLVVSQNVRRLGLGERMVTALAVRARVEGFARLCAFAHNPAFFVRRLGFSIVPHTWVPEKIAHDCYSCPLFRNCSQHAVVFDLEQTDVQTNVRAGVQTDVRTTV